MSFIESISLFVVFPIWLVIMSRFAYFYLHVSSAAIRRWATENDYRIIKLKTAGPFEAWGFASGNGQRVYRVVVEDKAAHVKKGLLRVGNPYWNSMSVVRCPVENRWGSSQKPSLDSFRPPEKAPSWDRKLA